MGHRSRRPGGWPQIAPPERFARLLPERLRPREGRSALMFGVRMVLAVAVTFLLIGVSGYLALEHELANKQIADFASSQRADAKSFEAYAAHASSRAVAIANVDRLLEAVASRPGPLGGTVITR